MKNCLYFTGRKQDSIVFQMEDSASYYEWEHEMLEIKSFIANINTYVPTDDLRAPLYLQWRTMVLKFGEKWSSAKVPQDIKDALKSVEVALTVDVTQW